MNEIGLFIKLSDSVEFLCIRAYQPLPYKYSITKGRITRGERNDAVRSLHRDSALRRRRVGEKGAGNSAKGPVFFFQERIVAHMPEKRERHDKLDLMTVAKKRDMKRSYREDMRPKITRENRRRCDDRRQSTGNTAWLTERVRAPGKKRTRIQRRRLAYSLVHTLVRSLASERTRVLYIEEERERERERENEASARVHYDSCIYIRSKNIRARCVPAGPARYFI
ncbi:hypothetical protein ALC53_05956 [Atta colombica]|uniref:Uncharacterized protein n=1 Tax=Atta colombica TaxID=520822 RepID=A0A195BHA9_9HYME|nr:hypothetical protein ALC53_05956 [Atta colombica]